jgi:hypothetical protein
MVNHVEKQLYRLIHPGKFATGNRNKSLKSNISAGLEPEQIEFCSH